MIQESRNLVLAYEQIGLLMRNRATSKDVKALPHQINLIRNVQIKEEHINYECELGKQILWNISLIKKAQDMYVKMREHSSRGWGIPQAPSTTPTTTEADPKGGGKSTANATASTQQDNVPPFRTPVQGSPLSSIMDSLDNNQKKYIDIYKLN